MPGETINVMRLAPALLLVAIAGCGPPAGDNVVIGPDSDTSGGS
jgi:hypothetical protein